MFIVWVRTTTHKDKRLITHAVLKWTLFTVIFLEASGQFVGWHLSNTAHLFVREFSRSALPKYPDTNTPRQTGVSTHTYHTPDDRQSVKTCVRLICLGIKTGRQLRNLRQQSIPQTICFHHLYEPNDYLQPAVSTERMNKFMWVLWIAWGARINLHAFHAWIWVIDSQMRIEFGVLICRWPNYKWKHTTCAV